MTKDIILIDLFAGAGGFHKGLQQAGFNITKCYFSEIDKHAIANYKYNFNEAEYIGSVVNVSGRTIRERHPNQTIIVCGGFPCQDISIAGKRKGVEVGTRSGLFFELVRIIAESECQYFIAENVKGLSSIGEGRTFYEVLRFLSSSSESGPQYNVEMQLCNTSWLLPQNRERFFFVGSLTTASGTKVFPITENDTRLIERTKQTTATRFSGGGGKDGEQLNSRGQLGRDAQQYDLTPCVKNMGKLRDTEIANCIDSNYAQAPDNHGQRTLIKYNEPLHNII